MQIDYTLDALLNILPEAKAEGRLAGKLDSIASLSDAGPGALSFLANPKYRRDLERSQAGAILVPEALDAAPAPGQAFLRVPDPSLALAVVCERLEAEARPRPAPGIHPSAVVEDGALVDPAAVVGPQCYVGHGAQVSAGATLSPGVFVGRGARVGEGSLLHPGSAVHDYCELGRYVILQPGAVIGSDGFGYLQVGGQPPALYHRKIPQVGIVVLEDDVEIGANSTVDRARFGETRIGQGSKIDNLVQIGHNVRIGRRCIICSQAGISGSTTIGDYVVIWGQAGLAGHLEIGSGAFVGAQAGVAKSVPAGAKITGTPAREIGEVRHSEAFLRRLPERFRKIEDLLKSQCA